ncbi:MAG: hypothetical protein Terrestrivirus1_266 [Terrestrivirus sp.]|uniref:Uncharacterized protein n=1 Tax=Terrestrivirus sp. TaxID=2487775 RepID=A0A3G4ZKM0_9VIRU|nr:MAG: hypothetical protein Terrestrivirus1_266 [Terrestrivirus sp.]
MIKSLNLTKNLSRNFSASEKLVSALGLKDISGEVTVIDTNKLAPEQVRTLKQPFALEKDFDEVMAKSAALYPGELSRNHKLLNNYYSGW